MQATAKILKIQTEIQLRTGQSTVIREEGEAVPEDAARNS
jgi:hypothetical protein